MDISILMNCYCKSRKTTNFYSKMLQSENIGAIEKEAIYDLLLESVKASTKIKNLCERRYEHCECEVPLE
ncbi:MULTISPECIES: hypothetical protein [Solibacillus]|uniref:Uncharacterized protein n=1 Tax=Solibacillus merdavium TaxID=2762218 RepID=A0ABR8XS61_9BACL|nr:hypothetical protein [Solibacillus merdavium]MBD8034790.1 hypothetical protein [Solibacillus merdavium]